MPRNTGGIGTDRQGDRARSAKKIKSGPVATVSNDFGPDQSNEQITADIKRLTRDIEKGREFIRFALSELPREEQWLQLRQDLQGMLDTTLDTVCKIVVLGTSGVGKSTVLNALVDENLLPSRGTGHACTSVPIEVHYDDSTHEGHFRAEIQYVTEDVWYRAVVRGQEEADYNEDERGDVRQGSLQAMEAVYPRLSSQELATLPVDQIISSNHSKTLLGTCVTLQISDRSQFVQTFREEVGSKKKAGFETWPLVDHVRLYVRHPLLKDGLVLVDVPGLYDLNRARVDKTNAYLARCSAVCIMTPSVRAGSDNTQKALLERALNQVQYDGRLENVMLVCTKSDDIDAQQAVDDYGTPEVLQSRQLLKAARKKLDDLHEQIKTWKDEFQTNQQTADFSQKDVQRWINAQKKASGDWDLFQPPRRRLAGGKFTKVENDDRVWSQEDVDEEVSTFKSERGAALARCKELKAMIASAERKVNPAKLDVDELQSDILHAVCKVRNDALRKSQAVMCLSAIKEYERSSSKAQQATSDGTTDTGLDPEELDDVESRCFCVSGLSYAYLMDLPTDTSSEKVVNDSARGASELIRNITDTEIPALSRSMKKVALKERQHRLRKVEGKLQLWLGSLRAQLSPNVREQDIDTDLAGQAVQAFSGSIVEFLQVFSARQKKDATVKAAFREYFADELSKIQQCATSKAVKRLTLYAKQPTMEGSAKGLYAGEYKAAVHPGRNGFYVTKRSLDDGNVLCVDFNDTVAAVIKCAIHKLIKQIRTDQSTIKRTIAQMQRSLEDVLEKLNNDFRLHSLTAGVTVLRVSLADEQFERRIRDLRRTFIDVSQSINAVHVEPSTRLSGYVEQRMIPGYARAYQKSGNGARKAMSDEVAKALNGEDVVGGTLKALNSGMSAELDKILATLSEDLGDMTRSIAAEYTGYMEDRGQTTHSTGDPKLDNIRNRMIALGYDKSDSSVVKSEPRDAVVKDEEMDGSDGEDEMNDILDQMVPGLGRE